MKIGLIGNIVLDEIRTFNGTVTKSWGGAKDILSTDFNYIMGTNG